MNRAWPRTRKVAERLMIIERSSIISDEDAAEFPVIDRLRPHLANLMGQGGFRALLARSLVLASAEIPWLRVGRINANGDMEGLAGIVVRLESAELLEGKIGLLAQLIGLLVALIGPDLTSRLIGDVWPQIPPEERDFGRESDHEKAR